MNRIECHFAPFRKFVLDNSDYPNHQEIAKAAQRYIRWRNRYARDKKMLKEQKSNVLSNRALANSRRLRVDARHAEPFPTAWRCKSSI